MVGVTTAWGAVLKGHSIRKVENHCFKNRKGSCPCFDCSDKSSLVPECGNNWLFCHPRWWLAFAYLDQPWPTSPGDKYLPAVELTHLALFSNGKWYSMKLLCLLNVGLEVLYGLLVMKQTTKELIICRGVSEPISHELVYDPTEP